MKHEPIICHCIYAYVYCHLWRVRKGGDRNTQWFECMCRTGRETDSVIVNEVFAIAAQNNQIRCTAHTRYFTLNEMIPIFLMHIILWLHRCFCWWRFIPYFQLYILYNIIIPWSLDIKQYEKYCNHAIKMFVCIRFREYLSIYYWNAHQQNRLTKKAQYSTSLIF